MPQHIQAPDGSLVEFPDGMSDDQILAVMQKAYGGGERPTSQALGFMEGLAKPLSKIPANPLNYIPGLDARPAADANQRAVQSYFGEREKTERPGVLGTIAGEVVGTAPVAAVVRNPFALGATQGALTSDAKTAGGVATDAAIGGALGHYGGKAIDAVADFIKPVVEPAVQRLADAGVKLTPGMIKGGKAMVREDKAMSRPFLGDKIAAGRQSTQDTFNTATVNRALEPLGVKVSPGTRAGYDAVSEAHQAVSDAYDQVIPNIAVTLDTRAMAQALSPAAAALKPAERKQLQSILNNQIGNGQLAGQQLKDAQGEIRRLAKNYSQSQSADDKELGRALWAADQELTQGMLLQNPKWAPDLQKANAAFRGLALVEDAASRADDGVFNTGQLKQAVRRGDSSARKNASAQGDAFMQGWSNDARSVIPSRTPNSGTADRMMSGNVFANLKGRLDAMGYDADNIFQQVRLAPRPAGAEPAANAVKRLKGPGLTTAVSAAHELRR